MIRIDCIFSPAPRQVVQIALTLPHGSLVKDALVLLHQSPEWVTYQQSLKQGTEQPSRQGLWGRMVSPNESLQEGDRLEIYRSLLVDPKLARKQRFKRQGKGRTGLFARRRVGAVAGY